MKTFVEFQNGFKMPIIGIGTIVRTNPRVTSVYKPITKDNETRPRSSEKRYFQPTCVSGEQTENILYADFNATVHWQYKCVRPFNLSSVTDERRYDLIILKLENQRPGVHVVTEYEVVEAAVTHALEVGYRHIDTAYMYQNEEQVGNAINKWIASGKGRREDLFVVTKLPFVGNRPEHVERFLKLSLQKLQLDYVDLYLIHSPIGFKYVDDNTLATRNEDGSVALDMSTDLLALWKAMEAQVDAGRAKSIGISNFSSEQIERIMKVARIPPANLQVELHLYFQQKPLRKTCEKYGITVCAYGALGSPGRKEEHKKLEIAEPKVPPVLSDSTVLSLAKKYGKTPAQVLLRHLAQDGIVVIPKSTNPERIKENFQIFDFELSDDEMKQLNDLDKGEEGRVFDFLKVYKQHPESSYHVSA